MWYRDACEARRPDLTSQKVNEVHFHKSVDVVWIQWTSTHTDPVKAVDALVRMLKVG